MSDQPAISVRNLAKMYRRYDSAADMVKEALHPLRKKYHKEFWALKDISFDVKKGEAIGIIGRNGSGKSTLLQILCGIMRPTRGDVIVNGRIAALLELGAGFSPEFTGRENIYMNGAQMGLAKRQIDAKFQEIVDFADIGDFIDQPVRTYSSGMFVRLAFAAAINADPDILIVDEALSVGDIAFQLKCMDRIKELRSRGAAIILVTHDPSTVKRICDAGCWINQGHLVDYGDSVKVTDAYMDSMREKKDEVAVKPWKDAVTTEDLPSILSIEMLNSAGKVSDQFACGESALVRIRYRISRELRTKILLGVAIHRNDSLYISGLTTKWDGVELKKVEGEHEITLEYPNLNLLGGSYYIKAAIYDYSAIVPIDINSLNNFFKVASPYFSEGIVYMEHIWKE